jgi:hypothetical protein
MSGVSAELDEFLDWRRCGEWFPDSLKRRVTMKTPFTRREFLTEVGRGMLVASLG